MNNNELNNTNNLEVTKVSETPKVIKILLMVTSILLVVAIIVISVLGFIINNLSSANAKLEDENQDYIIEKLDSEDINIDLENENAKLQKYKADMEECIDTYVYDIDTSLGYDDIYNQLAMVTLATCTLEVSVDYQE